jgi:hypothetical protein
MMQQQVGSADSPRRSTNLSKRYSASGLSSQDIAEIIVRRASPTQVAIESTASVA